MELYEFGPFRLDVAEHRLERIDGQPVGTLPEKAFHALGMLVENSGHLLTKKELIDAIWPDSFVEENNLDKCVHLIRNVLGESSGGQKYVETVRKHGYRFVAPVIRTAPRPAAGDVAAADIVSPEFVPAPAGSGPRSPFLLALGIVVVAILSAGFYFFPNRRAAGPGSTTLAVLPLKPVNTENRDTFYEGGLTDSIILKLSSVKGLTVRPLSAMRRYIDADTDAIAAGREQVVDFVLASNYQLSGSSIRISAQLFDVRTGEVAEAFQVEKQVGDAFEMQDTVAREVADTLVAHFELPAGDLTLRRGTANADAYRLFLHASNLMGGTSLPIAQEIVEYHEEAIKLDPRFGRAYAALARSRVELSNLVEDPGPECEKARVDVEKARELGPEQRDTIHASGFYKERCAWDFAGAERDLGRATELDPNSDSAHADLAHFLLVVGRFEQASAEIEQAISLNPHSKAHHVMKGMILFFAGRYDESIEVLRRADELGKLGLANGWVWTAYLQKGDAAQAFEWFLKAEKERQLKPDQAKLDALRSIYDRGGWRAVKEFLFDRENSSPAYAKGKYFRLARLSTYLGRNDAAFSFLNKAIEHRDSQILLLKYEPTFDPLRADARYPGVLAKVGFPPDK